MVNRWNTDTLTTWLGLIAVIAIALMEQGIYPKTAGVIAAVASACFAYLTNKTSVLPTIKEANYGRRHLDRYGSGDSDADR
jgi:putative flippase GtrA